MDKKYEIKLTLEEMKPLDGKVSEEAQKIIDKAKRESSFGFELPIMNEIINKSLEKGTLTWTYKQIRSCSHCDKKYDYYTYPRSGRYHSKGDKNYDKPKYYSGIKFNEGFITLQGDGDMCRECAEKYNVIHTLIDYIIKNDLPIQIQKNDYRITKYIKDDMKICFECGEEMQESKMGKLPAIMGGYYKGKCPHCGAESLPFGKSHESTNKFVMTLNPAFGGEKILKEIKHAVDECNKTNDKKLIYYPSNNNPNLYLVEVEYSNYYRVLKIDIATKSYEYKKWNGNIGEQFKIIVDKYGYEELKW